MSNSKAFRSKQEMNGDEEEDEEDHEMKMHENEDNEKETETMHPLHAYNQHQDQNIQLANFPGYVHKLDLKLIMNQFQSIDKEQVLTYIPDDGKQQLHKNPWRKIGDHKFWADLQKAMIGLNVDPWIRDAKQESTQLLRYFVLLAICESTFVPWKVHLLYEDWEMYS